MPMPGPSPDPRQPAGERRWADARSDVAGVVAMLEAQLAVMDQVRDWLRRSLLVTFALWVFTSIAREMYFSQTHRLPLAILLFLLGAAVLGIVLRAVLAMARSRIARQLQALRSEILIQDSSEATTRP